MGPFSLVHVDVGETVAFAARYDPRFSAMRRSGAWLQPHPWVEALLLTPILARNAELVEYTCRDAGDVTLPWSIEDNRPALRGLFRLFQQQMESENRAAAITTGQRLLKLNPSDEHGVRLVLERLSH